MEMGVLSEAYTNWLMIGFGIVGFITVFAGVCAFIKGIAGYSDWWVFGGFVGVIVGLAIGVPLFVFGFPAVHKYGDDCLKSHQASSGVYEVVEGTSSELVFAYNTDTKQISPDRFRVVLAGQASADSRHVARISCVGVPFSRTDNAEQFVPASLHTGSYIKTLAAPVDVPRYVAKYGDRWEFRDDSLPAIPK